MTPDVDLGRPVRKVLLYSHDTYGLGHLRRNLRIATRLLEAADSLRVVLVSGSPVAGRFPRPRGLELLQLPPVRKVGAEAYEPLDRRLSFDLVRRTRTAVVADVVRRLRPDVFLVDHAPAGMKGELLGVFDTIRRDSPATRTVLGLRDVLDDPGVVVDTWSEQGTYDLIEDVYDRVVVYGSRDVFDVGAEYAMPAALRDRLVFAGYLRPISPRDPGPAGPDHPYLLATAGGGGDGLEVLEAALEAGRLLGLHTVAVTGPLMSSPDAQRLAERAAAAGSAQLLHFHPDIQGAMAGAGAIVTMGGYNTLTEAVATGTTTVVVPRRHPRLEQVIRARLFAERGLVRVADPGPDLAQRIAAAATAIAPRQRPLDFDGLDRLSELVLTDRLRPATDRGPLSPPGATPLTDRLPA